MSEPTGTRRTSRKDPHASSACESCRARKVKCDDKRPACSACLKRGSTCVWTADKDGRTGRAPLLEKIAQLRAENARLEAENAALRALLLPAEPTPPSISADSPPGAPGTSEPLFAQMPAAANYSASWNVYSNPPAFATNSSYPHLAQHYTAYPEFYEQTTHPAACGTTDEAVFVTDEFGQLAGQYIWTADGQ